MILLISGERVRAGGVQLLMKEPFLGEKKEG